MKGVLSRSFMRLGRRHSTTLTFARASPWQSYTRLRLASLSTETSDTQSNKSGESVEAESPTDEKSAESNSVVFPWRHEDTLLPRLVEGTIDYTTKGQLLTSTSMEPGDKTMNAYASAFMFLDVPFYQFLFFGSWKAELADNASWAFTRGVAGLLSNISSTPIDSIIHKTYEIDFEQQVGPSDEASSDPTVPLEDMFDEKLLSLYKDSQKNLSSETEVHLKVTPVQTELYSLYAIPYLSRRKVKTDKALLEFYRTMMEKPSMKRAPDLNKLRREHLDRGKMESTVIAQVLVWCEETFFVKDSSSGKIVQGIELNGTQRIPHLIRMETTVKTTKDETSGTFRNVQDNWVITDIDDLVEGNLIV